MSKLSKAERRLRKQESRLLQLSETCVNCDAPLALDQRFCANCGGKRIYNRLTWRNLFEDFADRFLNLENAFIKTFICLFTRPEDVIGGYMQGMRKKYLPAFSYFAVAITVAGVVSFFIKMWFLDDIIAAQNELYTAGPAAEMQKEFSEKWLRWVMEYQSLVYFSAIPLLALISKMVFWNYKKFNFVEHLVIYLYAYSHVAMMTSILGLMLMWNNTLYQIFSFVSILGMIFYVGYVLKRLFNLDGGQIVLKTGLFFLISGLIMVVLTLIVFGVGIYMATSGALDDNELFKNMKRAQQELKVVKDSISMDTLQQGLERLKDTLQ